MLSNLLDYGIKILKGDTHNKKKLKDVLFLILSKNTVFIKQKKIRSEKLKSHTVSALKVLYLLKKTRFLTV